MIAPSTGLVSVLCDEGSSKSFEDLKGMLYLNDGCVEVKDTKVHLAYQFQAVAEATVAKSDKSTQP